MTHPLQPDTRLLMSDDLFVVSNDAFFGQEVQERCDGLYKLCTLFRIRDVASLEQGPSSVALVDIDSFGGISRCFEGLRLVRRVAPQRPVLIVSRMLRYDDFSLERAAICDASLSWPHSTEGLQAGISVAQANNRALQRRSAAAILAVQASTLAADAATLPVAAE